MLARLSDFLRSTLDRTDTDEIPLSEEIDFACQYLEIEEVRFGERLRVDIAVEPGSRDGARAAADPPAPRRERGAPRDPAAGEGGVDRDHGAPRGAGG